MNIEANESGLASPGLEVVRSLRECIEAMDELLGDTDPCEFDEDDPTAVMARAVGALERYDAAVGASPEADAPDVYKFHWDCGRLGDVEGVFIARPSWVDKAIGEEVYFGEILGKHSEIYGTLKAHNLKRLNLPPAAVGLLRDVLGEVGYNPLRYIDDGEFLAALEEK